MAKHQFQTDVNQLLQLIIHSLYSHREIFLRELISNASDALDKLKFLNLTQDEFKSLDFDPRIDIQFDTDANTLTIADSGIGMNQEDLTANLGTIASSGTRHFVEQMTGDAKNDANLIGQFGVGFYSVFMVSDKVEVITRKAGEETAWRWVSEGQGEYTVQEAVREAPGTTITCSLNDEGKEYTSRSQIDGVVKKYSNHIPYPIFLHFEETRHEGEGDDRKEIKEAKVEQVNAASAFWKRQKGDLEDEEYNEFYKNLTGDQEDPLLWIHTQAEGALEYSTLFYIPAKAPWDLFRSDYQAGVKLYVKRVFITDDDRELMPGYLRFLRGVIDSEDLPLNVSREILQKNRVMTNITTASVKKVLSELAAISGKDPAKFETFYTEFRKPLKEGVYQDFANRETLLELLRFKSTTEEGYTGLADYKNRMKPDQQAIYYITGENEVALRSSPLLEMYREKGLEVLIMDDEIDELVMPSVGKYKDTDLKAVNRSGAAEELKTEADKEAEEKAAPIVERIKKALGEQVKDVRVSARLTDSPSCIVADETDPTVQMQQMFRAMGQGEMAKANPILEINPKHAIVDKLAGVDDEERFADVSQLLLEQALLIEGVELANPAEFAKRLNRFVGEAL